MKRWKFEFLKITEGARALPAARRGLPTAAAALLLLLLLLLRLRLRLLLPLVPLPPP